MHRTRHILPIPRTCIWHRCGRCGVSWHRHICYHAYASDHFLKDQINCTVYKHLLNTVNCIHGPKRVSLNTTSAPSVHRRPVFVDCHSRRLGIDTVNVLILCTEIIWPTVIWYCHFELCRDCGLGWLIYGGCGKVGGAVAVVFLYQITVFTTKHNSITFGTLF